MFGDRFATSIRSSSRTEEEHDERHDHDDRALDRRSTRDQAPHAGIPGQRSDGTFAVSASRQLPGEREAVLDRILPVVIAALGFDPTSQSRGGKRPSARWTSPDRESVLLNTEDGPKPGTVRVSLQRERLTGPERMPDAKAELQQLLAGL
jgi:hypothetical protein